MSAEDNGNVGLLKPTSSSNEDLSEYTDADESISAPTEFLAEFLSAVMLKDYETALKYCKLILQYEPNNVTAKEFYPLILEKLQQINNEEEVIDDDGGENCETSGGSSSGCSESGDSSASSDADSSEEQEDEDDEDEDEEEEECVEEQAADKDSKGSSEGDATTGSYSSLEDDEIEIDQLAALAAKYHIDNMNLGGNGNKIYSNETLKNSFNTSGNFLSTTQGMIVNHHHHHHNQQQQQQQQQPFGISSDSESPTEPVSQQTIAMLRAKCVPNNI